MTRYKIKTQKIYLKKDRKLENKKIRKYGNGNAFLSLMKTVGNLVEKLYIYFC